MYKRRTKPKVSADYVVGLTDGEGCFYVLIKSPLNKEGGGRITLNFFIKVQEQDRGMLEKVRNTLKCGTAYFQPESRENHSQCYRYTVNTHAGILGVIIPFFIKHPLQSKSKRKNFELFCKIAKLVKIGAHHSKSGLDRIRLLKSQMNLRTRVVREIRTLRGNAK
ncbi:MAG: LAGLIDADG family homing endonuclease [Candidatus Doudnabacteria bacterium]|nr:LAGLIDADG family homing endonuclease [Candidatus Doudnabacteria bacterium]